MYRFLIVKIVRYIFLRGQRFPRNIHNCSTLCFSGFGRLTICFSVVVLCLIICFYCIVLYSISCVWYGILIARNLDLSIWDLIGPLKLIFESDINRSTHTYILTTCMVHRNINSLTLKNKPPGKNRLKGRKPCGGCP